MFLFHHYFFGDILIPKNSKFDIDQINFELDFALGIIKDFLIDINCINLLNKVNLVSTRICTNQKLLFSKIAELDNAFMLKSVPQSSGLSAAIIDKRLVVLSSSYFIKLRPEYTKVDHSWSRLIAHELGHIIHIELLNGNESKMGPQWFYEGFALHVGGNICTRIRYNSAQEALEPAYIKNRKSYLYYYNVFEYFLEKIELVKLFENASIENFEEWLIEMTK